MPKMSGICKNPECLVAFEFYTSITRPPQQYCTKKCEHSYKPDTMAERLWSKITICSHGYSCIYCCWPWGGAQDKYGHGYFNTGNNVVRTAHRVVWQLHHNRIMPEDRQAAHECNNGNCCNPTHIYPATSQQNVNDTIRAGRHAWGNNNGHAKLNDKKIVEIFFLYRQGFSQMEIATHLEISKGNVGATLLRKQWKHLLVGDTSDISTISHGNLSRKGMDNPSAKLLEVDIPVIFAMARSGCKQRKIAEHFHVSVPTIQAVLSRRNWGYVVID